MEKELGLPKPGDLLIGVIDFFAVLIPGVIAAALIVTAGGSDLQRANTVLVGGLITAGWWASAGRNVSVDSSVAEFSQSKGYGGSGPSGGRF